MKPMAPRQLPLRLLLVAAASLAADASAAVLWKDATSTDLLALSGWSTASGAATPDPTSFGTTDTLRFNEVFAPTSGTMYTATMASDLTVGAIRTDSGTGGGGSAFGNVTISGAGVLTLNGNNDYTTGTVQGIVLNSANGGTLTIATNIKLGATQQWVNSRALNVSGNVNLNGFEMLGWVAGGTSSTISGNVSGTGGSISLRTASSPTGLMLLSGSLSGSFALRHYASNAILAIGGSTTSGYTGNIELGNANGGTFRVDTGATLVTSGQFNHNWNKTLVMNGTLTTGAASVSTNATTNLSGSGSFTNSALYLFNQVLLNNTMTGSLTSQGNIVLGASSASASSAGTLTLGGTGSTYAAGIQFGSASTAATGTLNLNAGTLFVGAAGMLDGSTGANTIAVNLGGGTLAAQAAWSSALALTLTSATTSTLNTAGGDISLSGVIGGAGNLRKLGTGTLSLSSSSSTFTGGVTVVEGTLAVSKLSDAGVNSSLGAGTGGITFNGGNLSYIGTGDSTNRTVDLLAGGTVSANGSGAVQFTAASLTHSGTASARTLNLGGSSTAGNTFGLAIGDSGTGAALTSLAKSGAGTWILSGTSGYTGTTSVNAGTLVVSGSINSTSGISVADTANLRIVSSVSPVISVASGGTVSGTGTASSVTLANGGRLSPGVTSSGVLTLVDLTIGAIAGDKGYVDLGITGLPGVATLTSSLNLTGGIVTNGGNGSIVFNFGAQLGGLAEGEHDLLTYAGILPVELAVFDWAGTKGARQGLEIIDTGTKLQLDVASDFPIWTGTGTNWSAATGNWVLSKGGDTAFLAGDTVRFDDTASSGVVEITENVVPVSASFVSNTRDYAVSSAGGFGILGGALVKSGSATLTLNTANAFDAGVTLSGGRVVLGNASALGSGSIALSAGTLDLGGLTLANAIVMTGGSIDAQGGRLNGILSGAGELAVDSALTLGAAATHTGGTRVTAGALTLGVANALPDAGAVTLDGATASLSLAFGAETVGALALRNGASVQASSNLTAASLALESGTITGATTLTAGSYDLRLGSIAPTLAGTAALAKTTSGTVVLSGASTYTGTTTVSGGILQFGDGGASGSIGSGGAGAAGNLVTVESGATLRFFRTGLLDYKATARMRHVTGGGDIVINGGVKLWNYTGSGTGFADANSWSNFTGRLLVLGGSEFQTIRNGRTAMGSAQVILGDATTSGILSQVEGSWTWTNAISLVGSANIIRNNSGGGVRSLKLQGVISGAGNLTFEDTTGGIDTADRGFILTAANTLSGSLTIAAHTRVGGVTGDDTTLVAGTSGSLGTAAVTINSGRALTFSRSDAHTVANILSGAGQVRVGSSGITGTGTQVLTLSGANTYTGGTELLQGTLSVADLSALGGHTVATNDGYLAVKGGARFSYTGGNATTTRNLFMDSGAATIEVVEATTVLGWNDASLKNQAFTKAGAGTLVLGGAFTGSASLTVDGGVLRLTGANALSSGITLTAGELEVSDTGVLGASGAYAGAIANAGLVTFSGTADHTLTGSLTGAGSLEMSGSGILTLGASAGAANTFSGGITLSGGRLVAGNAGAFGSGAIQLDGGVLDFNLLDVTNTVVFSGGSLVNVREGSAVTLAGTFSAQDLIDLELPIIALASGSTANLAGVNLSITLNGTSTISGLTTFAGTLAVAGGVLDLSSPSNRPAPGVLELRSGGEVNFGTDNFSGTIAYKGGTASGAFSGVLDLQASGLTLAAGSAANGSVRIGTGLSATLGAGFANDVRLEGTAALIGDYSTYAGTLTLADTAEIDLGIDPDRVLLANFVLSTGGRLAGQGTVGDVTVLAGGVLAPGNSPGTQTVDGNLALSSAGLLEFEVVSAVGIGTPVAGTDYDTMIVTGELNLSALSSTNRFVIDLISLDGNGDGAALVDFDPLSTFTFTLIEYNTLSLGANAGLGANITSLFTLNTGAFLDLNGNEVAAGWSVINDISSSSISLTYAPIPEPSTYGLILGGLALAATALRRKRRQLSAPAA
jgi:autotransporter-associated beta strand protein